MITVRPVALSWEDRPLPRPLLGDDLVLGHLAAVLSAAFPEGGAFFVRSVRRFRDQIDDPVLGDRVRAFCAQEAIHAREHRALNRRLAELGYPTRHLDRRAGWALRLLERLLSPAACLAATAALEHGTATLADALLTSAEVRAIFDDDQLRTLVLWHALEEAEHRAVAFDVYQQVDGRTWLRTILLRIALVTTTLDFASALACSLACDPLVRRHPRQVWRSLRALRRSPFAGLGLGATLLDYTRPDFHPNDHGDPAVLVAWRAELFGELTPSTPPA